MLPHLPASTTVGPLGLLPLLLGPASPPQRALVKPCPLQPAVCPSLLPGLLASSLPTSSPSPGAQPWLPDHAGQSCLFPMISKAPSRCSLNAHLQFCAPGPQRLRARLWLPSLAIPALAHAAHSARHTCSLPPFFSLLLFILKVFIPGTNRNTLSHCSEAPLQETPVPRLTQAPPLGSHGFPPFPHPSPHCPWPPSRPQLQRYLGLFQLHSHSHLSHF